MRKKSRKAEPSLDDPRWQPLLDEYKLISQHRGNSQLAYIDLNQALANGRVRCMRRRILTGETEPLLPEFWAHRALDAVLPVFVALRLPNYRGPSIKLATSCTFSGTRTLRKPG